MFTHFIKKLKAFFSKLINVDFWSSIRINLNHI